MTSRQQCDIDIADRALLAKGQDMLVAFAGQARLHQPRGPLRNDDLLMRRNVIAVRVRHESERLRFPWIEPQILRGQVNASLVLHLDHEQKVAQASGLRTD